MVPLLAFLLKKHELHSLVLGFKCMKKKSQKSACPGQFHIFSGLLNVCMRMDPAGDEVHCFAP